MIDIARLTKDEIIKMAKWKCPLPGHSKHSGLSHTNCYQKLTNHSAEERVLFFDIEAEDLKADYGIMFCWVAMDADTEEMSWDVLSLNDIKKYSTQDRNKTPKEDCRIIQSLIKKMSEYDRVCAHYGSRYDLPFARTRAVMCGIDFPRYGELYQTDTWIILKNKFKLSRNTLMNGTLKLTGQTRKDHLSLSIKHGCLRGEKWALDLALHHCKNDVRDLRDLYKKVHQYIKKSKTSI